MRYRCCCVFYVLNSRMKMKELFSPAWDFHNLCDAIDLANAIKSQAIHVKFTSSFHRFTWKSISIATLVFGKMPICSLWHCKTILTPFRIHIDCLKRKRIKMKRHFSSLKSNCLLKNSSSFIISLCTMVLDILWHNKNLCSFFKVWRGSWNWFLYHFAHNRIYTLHHEILFHWKWAWHSTISIKTELKEKEKTVLWWLHK